MSLPLYPEFDADTIRELGVYIYALSDPRNGEIFYVGKGQDNRWYSHIKSSRENKSFEPSEKIEKIREIEGSGNPVQVHFLRSGLQKGKQGDSLGFLVEATVIDALNLAMKLDTSSDKKLTNLVAGHESIGRKCISLGEAAQLFNAEPISQIDDPVILVNLARTWAPDMTPAELWEYTRNAWKVSQRRNNAKYLLGVSYGIIRGGYEISSWREWGPGDRNFNPNEVRFVAESAHAPESHPSMAKYIQKNVKSLLNNPQWSVRYFNC